MNKTLLKRYVTYIIRWQLSTPILAFCIMLFANVGTLWSTIIANFIGSLLFFWVDKFIFTSNKLEYKGPVWDVLQYGVCDKCKKSGRVYRLIKCENIGYNRTDDENPKFLCEKHSNEKYERIIN